MARRGFLTNIAYTNGLWIAGLLVLLVSGLGNMVLYRGAEIEGYRFYDVREIVGDQWASVFQNDYLNQCIRFLLLFGSAMILQYISSEFRLIRIRSHFPFFLFCVFSATIIPVLPLNGAAVSCFFFSWSCLRLFAAIDSPSTNRAAFDASFLLVIASLFQSRVLFLLPVFWIVLGIMQVLNFKSFFASLFGGLCTLWIVGGLSFLFDNFGYLINYFQQLVTFELVDFTDFSTAEITYFIFLGILMISAMFSFWPKQNLDKLRTRNYLNSILLLWFALLTLWIFSSNNMGFLLLLLCLSALMAAHFFSLIDTRYSRALFILLLILSVTVFILF